MSIQPIFKADSNVRSTEARINLVMVKEYMSQGQPRGRISFSKRAADTLEARCVEWRNYEVYVVNRAGVPHFAPVITRGLMDHRAIYRMRRHHACMDINSTPIVKLMTKGHYLLSFIGPDKELNAHVSALGAEVGPWFVLRKKV